MIYYVYEFVTNFMARILKLIFFFSKIYIFLKKMINYFEKSYFWPELRATIITMWYLFFLHFFLSKSIGKFVVFLFLNVYMLKLTKVDNCPKILDYGWFQIQLTIIKPESQNFWDKKSKNWNLADRTALNV